MIRVKRVYEIAKKEDGFRVLVDPAMAAGQEEGSGEDRSVDERGGTER